LIVICSLYEVKNIRTFYKNISFFHPAIINMIKESFVEISRLGRHVAIVHQTGNKNHSFDPSHQLKNSASPLLYPLAKLFPTRRVGNAVIATLFKHFAEFVPEKKVDRIYSMGDG